MRKNTKKHLFKCIGLFGRVMYHLKILSFYSKDGEYGYTINKYNPLSWFMIVMYFVSCIPCCMFFKYCVRDTINHITDMLQYPDDVIWDKEFK